VPPTPTEGQIWFNSVEGKLLIFYDGFWVETIVGEVGATGPTGPAGSSTLYTPTTPLDWVTTPNTISEALDQLASRIKALEP
jgi:hypothetical protein